MAIVLDTSPAGAIASYSDLVAELRDLTDNAAYDVGAISRAVRKAEAYFLRKLRLADMEVSTSLTVSAATASLPPACREIRAVVWLAPGQESPLKNMSLVALESEYGGQSTGAYPYAYAREGLTLRFAPVCSGTARLVYYADLIPLSDQNPSNWLLLKAPDLYVAGAMYYLCQREHDDAGMQMFLQQADGILHSLQEEANRLAGGNMVPQGITQTRFVRV